MAKDESFKWTDALVMEFARIFTEGPYGQYEGCRSMESKLERFKMLREAAKSEDKETVLKINGGQFLPWYSSLDEEGQQKYKQTFQELQEAYERNKSMG